MHWSSERKKHGYERKVKKVPWKDDDEKFKPSKWVKCALLHLKIGQIGGTNALYSNQQIISLLFGNSSYGMPKMSSVWLGCAWDESFNHYRSTWLFQFIVPRPRNKRSEQIVNKVHLNQTLTHAIFHKYGISYTLTPTLHTSFVRKTKKTVAFCLILFH